VLVNADGRLGRLGRRRQTGIPRRELRGLGRRSLPRPRARTVAAVAAVLLLLAGGWMWFRDSSLVAVRRVSVSGVSGPDAAQIRAALTRAAKTMTTLDVNIGALRTAVQPYPVVKHLQVSTRFPHGMRIRVVEQIPVAAIGVNGRTTAVSADGTLLHDVVASSQLPVIPLRVPPGGSRLTDSGTRDAVAVLAAAPYDMLGHISQVTTVTGHGLVAQLRNGPSLYFGTAERLRAKWAAAIAVLADSGSVGAGYIDISDPERPAAGAGTTGSSSQSAGISSASTPSPSATPAASSSSANSPTSSSTSTGTGGG
jgi:cell division protein FtsQ